jgi:sugar/nucleoside kinase (ribokinase family)
MKVAIFGDANVDVTISWADAEKSIDKLSARNRKLILTSRSKLQQGTSDMEFYLKKPDSELSKFFNSLNPAVKTGGCGAIKALTMAKLGHKVVFYSWVGNDGNGLMVLDELSDAGVDVSNVIVSGKTCETYNIFEPGKKRLAFSYWRPKLKFSKYLDGIVKSKPDSVFLTGAHRVKSSLGYAKLPGAFVFTGSFFTYTKAELSKKFAGDLSAGVLVSNDSEIMQLSGQKNAFFGMKKLPNRLIVMHSPHITAVKRGREIIVSRTAPLDRSKIKELTGIGDVWEAVFLGSVTDLSRAQHAYLKHAMHRASEAAAERMAGSDL